MDLVGANGNETKLHAIDDQLPSTVDNLLSRELLNLSLHERNAIDEEIHGVSILAPVETPQLLAKALSRLTTEIEKVPNGSPIKAAYIQSQNFSNTHVNTNDFRLIFLRCELFDARKAALRMLNFLNFTSDLFGQALLQRPIRMTDLTKREEKLLRTGNTQVLPYRDRAGRPIHAWVGDFGLQHADVIARAKISFYLLSTMAEDVESQRKGFISVTWALSIDSIPSLPTWRDVKLFKRLFEASPIRTCTNHICIPDKPAFHILRSMFTMSRDVGQRSRIKFHIGKEVEIRYKVKSFGIPVELIPVTGTGNIKVVHHKQWMKVRKYLDDKRAKRIDVTPVIACPSSTDILFRSGTSLTVHPGNAMFQSIIESKINEHTAASQVEKAIITKEIIDLLKQREARFLQWDTRGWWTEIVSATQIHTKVAVSTRDFKSKSVAQRNLQTSCQQQNNTTTLSKNYDGKRRRFSDKNVFVCDKNAYRDVRNGDKCMLFETTDRSIRHCDRCI